MEEITVPAGRGSIWRRLKRKWSDMQIGHQGSYSVERLESLEHYCRTTSKTRVVLVCILTPLPALTTAVLLECLPLRPPSDGWRANWMFWIRLSLMAFALCFVGFSELATFLPKLKFTLCKTLTISLGSCSGFVLVCLLVADTVGFPVPYTWMTVGLVYSVFVPVMILLVFGRKPFEGNSGSRQDLNRFLRFFFAYTAVAMTFPLCKAVYKLVPGTYHGFAVVMLYVGGRLAEHFVLTATRELEDFIPGIIAFSVDLSTTLFVSVCISASPSIHVVVLFIGVDIGQLLLEFFEVCEDANIVIKVLQRDEERRNEKSAEMPGDGNLISRLVAVTRDPKAFQLTSIKDVRLWACLPHPLTQQQVTHLTVLEASGIYKSKACSFRRKRTQARSRQRLPQVGPSSTTIVPAEYQRTEKLSSSTRSAQWKTFLLEGVQLLFYCECLVLVEYVECIVPLVYVVYKAILQLLPNITYYPVEYWGPSAIVNVFMLAALETGSLFLFNFFLQRKFSFSPMYQLAFVLETQMHVIQASLFIEIVILLQFELAHLGVDFTFSFEWLRG